MPFRRRSNSARPGDDQRSTEHAPSSRSPVYHAPRGTHFGRASLVRRGHTPDYTITLLAHRVSPNETGSARRAVIFELPSLFVARCRSRQSEKKASAWGPEPCAGSTQQSASTSRSVDIGTQLPTAQAHSRGNLHGKRPGRLCGSASLVAIFARGGGSRRQHLCSAERLPEAARTMTGLWLFSASRSHASADGFESGEPLRLRSRARIGVRRCDRLRLR